MNILALSAIAVITAVLALTFAKTSPHTATLISLCGGCVILIYALPYVKPIIMLIKSIAACGGIDGGYILIAVKAAGLGIAVSVCSAVCSDAGQTAVAAKLEIAGRIAIMLTALPVINGMLGSIISAIG